jgi:DNA-binding transcriptional MerR regulator
MFSPQDLEQLQFIKYLTQENGINIQGVKFLLEAIALAEREGVKLKRILFPSFKPAQLL